MISASASPVPMCQALSVLSKDSDIITVLLPFGIIRSIMPFLWAVVACTGFMFEESICFVAARYFSWSYCQPGVPRFQIIMRESELYIIKLVSFLVSSCLLIRDNLFYTVGRNLNFPEHHSRIGVPNEQMSVDTLVTIHLLPPKQRDESSEKHRHSSFSCVPFLKMASFFFISTYIVDIEVADNRFG
jgi:hypothetical protein